MAYVTSIERQGRQEGLREGIEQGMQQGMQQGHRTIVQNLRAMEMDSAFIEKATGLSEKEIAMLL